METKIINDPNSTSLSDKCGNYLNNRLKQDPDFDASTWIQQIWDITPDAQRTFKAVSDPLQSLEAIILELTDNSDDEKAKHVYIQIHEEDNGSLRSKISISITDDGNGMDFTALKNMFTIGKSGSHKGFNTQGHKGLGAIAAGMAAGKKMWVITKTEDGEMLGAMLDFSKVKEDTRNAWNDPEITRCFNEQEIDTYFPKEAITDFGRNNHGTTIYLEEIYEKWGKSKKIIANKLKRSKSKTHRQSISFRYRYLLLKGEIKIFIDNARLFPSGHGHNVTVEGKELDFTYFRDKTGGRRDYNITMPDGRREEFSAYYIQENYAQCSTTPGKACIHLIRNNKEISTSKIELKGHQNDWSIGNLGIDLHLPATIVDSYMALSSDKVVNSLELSGHQDYDFYKVIYNAISSDIKQIKDYNAKNFIFKEDTGLRGVKKWPERIYQMRYLEWLREGMIDEGKSEEEINLSLKREFPLSTGENFVKFDILNENQIVEIKLTADRKALQQCLGYMADFGVRKINLVSIFGSDGDFLRLLKKWQEFYNVEIKYKDVSSSKRIRAFLLNPECSEAEKKIIAEYKRKQKKKK